MKEMNCEQEEVPIVPTDLTPIIVEYLSHNRGPDPDNPEHRQLPDYGVVATLDGAVLEIELTFRRGAAYCCEEWSCHFEFSDGKRWTRLRRQLNDAGIAVAPRLELRGKCVIEKGALFFDLLKPDPGRHGWFRFGLADAHSYEISYFEGSE